MLNISYSNMGTKPMRNEWEDRLSSIEEYQNSIAVYRREELLKQRKSRMFRIISIISLVLCFIASLTSLISIMFIGLDHFGLIPQIALIATSVLGMISFAAAVTPEYDNL